MPRGGHSQPPGIQEKAKFCQACWFLEGHATLLECRKESTGTLRRLVPLHGQWCTFISSYSWGALSLSSNSTWAAHPQWTSSPQVAHGSEQNGCSWKILDLAVDKPRCSQVHTSSVQIFPGNQGEGPVHWWKTMCFTLSAHAWAPPPPVGPPPLHIAASPLHLMGGSAEIGDIYLIERLATRKSYNLIVGLK